MNSAEPARRHHLDAGRAAHCERSSDGGRADRALRDRRRDVARTELPRVGTEPVQLVGRQPDDDLAVEHADRGRHRAARANRGLGREPDLDATWFDCDVLHISGYSLASEPIASSADAAAGHARAHGATVALDVSAWTLVDDAFRTRVATLAPELVFATEREQEAIGSLDTRWVLKRGARGLSVDGVDHPAAEIEVVDATGAGDALAAGFHVGGPELGVATAARCCTQIGAMP